jgi:uncharacterized protein YdeI (YjbR/CyaY-like superfamily)
MDDQILFTDREEFRKWLSENHGVSKGIWLVFGKAGKVKTLKADEALEEALCFGWIDGQLNSIDDAKYLKKFTPRRKGSKWSERNKGITSRLIENGQMTEYGTMAIEQAKRDGTWDLPNREPISDGQIEILTGALQGAEPALSNFTKMPLSVRRTYTAMYLDAKKEETRIRRLERIIERLNENKKPM